ncbi:EamA family transporter [Pseudactinotalea sp. Z1748]|uniref:EamA family transporter n=1 Tax=Pseudactinotalea sp. Z1748 TaxID=3413027 RepID=UPI003C7C3692
MRNPLDRVPAPLLFLIAGASQYLGAAIAVGLYPLMPAHTVAWLRSVVCALILLVLVQPWRRQHWTRRTFTQSAVFGVVLMAMNMLFYISIEYLPLGAAVAIEFAGPVAVAAWGGRTLRQRVAIVLAAFGVVAISVLGLDWAGAESGWHLLLGIACALAAGSAWAVYMLLGGRIVTERDGISSLAVGTAVASVLFAPIAAPWAGPALSMDVFVVVVAVGVLTSVIPYMLDQVTLKRLRMATFALLNALLPASATVIALLVLGQRPTSWELVGLAAISVALALAGRRTRSGAGRLRPRDSGDRDRSSVQPGVAAAKEAEGGPPGPSG